MDVAPRHGAGQSPLTLALLSVATGGSVGWWAAGYAMAADPHVQEFVQDAATSAVRKTKKLTRELYENIDGEQEQRSTGQWWVLAMVASLGFLCGAAAIAGRWSAVAASLAVEVSWYGDAAKCILPDVGAHLRVSFKPGRTPTMTWKRVVRGPRRPSGAAVFM